MESTVAGPRDVRSPAASGDSASDPLLGTVLDRRYHLLGRIASGGMAAVYEARDERLGRNVAVKVMRASESPDPHFVERLISEARSAAALSHPSIVSVYDQGVDGDIAYLVMEKVDGHTLRETLSEWGRMPADQAFAVMEPVLEALALAHGNGLIHRDVKPENVLLASGWSGSHNPSVAGFVKVADFGLARAIDVPTQRHTANGVVMGTVAYVAPEQISDPEAGPSKQSDVYSAGIMLFEMLTGAPPFTNPSAANVAFQHVHTDVPPPSAVLPGVSPEIDDVVLRATRRNPGERFQDAGEFLEAIRTIRRGGGLRVRTDRRTAALPPMSPSTPPPVSPSNSSNQAESTQVLNAVGAGATSVIPAANRSPEAGVYGPGVMGTSRRSHASKQNAARRRLLIIAGICVAAIFAAAIGGWLWNSGQTTITPSLVGVSKVEAERLVGNVGLDIKYEKSEFSETVKENHVVRQEPSANETIDHGGTVTVVLSKGPERHTIPDVSGMEEEAAAAKLEEATLRWKVIRENDKVVPEGSVVRTEPAAGQELPTGGYVTLVISKGAKAIKIPDVVGQKVEEAEQKLEGLGLKVRIQGDKDGTVAAQSPSAGNTAEEDDVVTIVGADGLVMPDVRGMSYKQAESHLEGMGLRVRKGPGSGDGEVFAQNPSEGSRVKRGERVTLWASL